MTKHTSDFIFSLANKYHIPLDENQPMELLDENYFCFCNEYIEHCKIRDKNLKEYLVNNPNLFRTFLPWRPYIFNTVFQTQWYYDELIIYDPIFFEINNFKSGNVEEDKFKLRQLLSFLYSLKDNITEGFLLFGSYETFSVKDDKYKEDKFDALLSIPEIREECDRLVEVYKMVGTNDDQNLYLQVACRYRNEQMFFSIPKYPKEIMKQHNSGIIYEFVHSNYIPLSVEEIKERGFYERVYDRFKKDYPDEIREILNYVDIGSNIRTPVLFDRDLDKLILSNISLGKELMNSKANDYFKLFLPFVEGIPTNRLFDIRTKMPTAFLDFRNLMFETIYDFEREGFEPEILKLKVQQKVNPLVRKLEAEMKNSITKAKIIGSGLPIISGIGALGLWHFGVDLTKYATLLFGGVNVAGLSTFVNYRTEQNTGKANSMYYLWKVQHK